MKDFASRPANRDRLLIAGLALLVSLFVVFVLFQAQTLVANAPDPYQFEELGRRIANGEGFRGELIGRRAPLYPMFIGLIYWVFGQHKVFVQLSQCLAFAGTALLARNMGERVYNRRTGLIAGLLCVVHPSFLRYVADFHLESLLTFLFTLCVWASIRFYQRPTLSNGALFGVAAGLTSLTKAVALLYPPLFLGIFWFTRRPSRSQGAGQQRPSIAAAVLVVAAMILTISPWTVRNYRVSGHFVPVSTGLSDAFLRGVVFSRLEFATLRKPPYTDAEQEVNAKFIRLCSAEGTVWEKDPVLTEKILNKEMKAHLLAEPGDVIRKSIVGVFTFWYEMTSLKTSLVAGLMALAGWVLTIIGVGRAHREGHPQWLLLAPMLYLNAFLAVLLALGRYSVPVLPCLLVTAAFGLDTLAKRWNVGFIRSGDSG